jgi:hypothetical protein
MKLFFSPEVFPFFQQRKEEGMPPWFFCFTSGQKICGKSGIKSTKKVGKCHLRGSDLRHSLIVFLHDPPDVVCGGAVCEDEASETGVGSQTIAPIRGPAPNDRCGSALSSRSTKG